MIAEAKLSRRERNKLRNRREILQAALGEFSEKGYHDTSIQDIAVRAEFAVGTIYALFGTKEELYRALLLEHAQEAGARLTEAVSTGANEYERLMNYVRVKGELFADKIPLARLIFTETLGTGICFKSGPNPELKRAYRQWHGVLAAVFQRGIERGLFRPGDPEAFAVSLEGLTNAHIYQWSEDPERYPYAKGIEAIRDTFFRSILLVDHT